MKKQTAIIFYVLSAYVVIQFLWWGFHLIELSTELADSQGKSNSRVIMVLGEGAVFFLLLIFGLWRVQKAIQREIKISQHQNNFLLSVTHELKTPLSSNKLYLQTLLKRKSLDEEQKEKIINQALLENKRLESMIENILTATRLDHHHYDILKKEDDLSAFVEGVVQKWSKGRKQIVCDIESGVRCEFDPFVINTTLTNLLDNALKYAGKNVLITAYLKSENDTVIFGVKDEGQGVPAKFRKEIFNKFTRIGNEETRMQKGTGLGLYIVKQLIEKHGDLIECLENEPNGTNFKITLNNG